MERFVRISSFFSFCPRWPLKNLLQQFLLVNSSARCSPSRSLTSLLRMNKLFWEDTSQKWNVTCTAKTFSLGLKVDPPLSHILVKLGFLCFWASRASLVFLPPVFKHIHLLWEARGEKMRKIDTSRGKYKGPSSKVQKIQVVRIVQHFVSEVFPFWTKKLLWKKIFCHSVGVTPIMGSFQRSNITSGEVFRQSKRTQTFSVDQKKIIPSVTERATITIVLRSYFGRFWWTIDFPAACKGMRLSLLRKDFDGGVAALEIQ